MATVTLKPSISGVMAPYHVEPSDVQNSDLTKQNQLSDDISAQNHTHFSNYHVPRNEDISIPIHVHYWPTRQSKLCNIIPNASRDFITIYGLRNDQEYAFCVFSTQRDICFRGSTEKMGHNCVVTKTEAPEVVENKLVVYTIILSCISFVFLLVLIVIIVISVRQHKFFDLFCAKQLFSKRTRSSPNANTGIQMAHLDTENQEIDLDNLNLDSTSDTSLLNSPIQSRVQVHPPRSPGKPKHQLVKERIRGYAAFSAKNEQTIPLSAVLEYDEMDIEEDLNDIAS